MGALYGIAMIPILPGDLITLQMDGLFRLASLRNHMTIDAKTDIFAFYVPHRHIYGDDWLNFIRQGVDESITFTSVSLTGGAVQQYIPYCNDQTDIPLWCLAGYNRIFNRYFRLPTDSSSILADTDFVALADSEQRDYGRKILRMKTPWSTPNLGTEVTADDSKIEVQSGSPDFIDLLDIKKIRAQYKTELERDFFNIRYSDIVDNVWKGSANIDADERPELIMRTSHPISGYDIDGQSGAEFGQFVGKGMSNASFGFRRRFFPEHGTLWILGTVRFPTVHNLEIHRLTKNLNPDYNFWAADPTTVEQIPPEDLELDEWLFGGGASSIGTVPYGQHYRHMPNRIAGKYRDLAGFPFLKTAFTTANQALYHQSADYDDSFQSPNKLGHWTLQAGLMVDAIRSYPTTRQSIYAGT